MVRVSPGVSTLSRKCLHGSTSSKVRKADCWAQFENRSEDLSASFANPPQFGLKGRGFQPRRKKPFLSFHRGLQPAKPPVSGLGLAGVTLSFEAASLIPSIKDEECPDG